MIRKEKWDEALSDPLQYGFYLLIPLHPSAPLPSRRRHGACNGRTRPISVHPAIPRRSIGLSLVHITKKLKRRGLIQWQHGCFFLPEVAAQAEVAKFDLDAPRKRPLL